MFQQPNVLASFCQTAPCELLSWSINIGLPFSEMFKLSGLVSQLSENA